MLRQHQSRRNIARLINNQDGGENGGFRSLWVRNHGEEKKSEGLGGVTLQKV